MRSNQTGHSLCNLRSFHSSGHFNTHLEWIALCWMIFWGRNEGQFSDFTEQFRIIYILHVPGVKTCVCVCTRVSHTNWYLKLIWIRMHDWVFKMTKYNLMITVFSLCLCHLTGQTIQSVVLQAINQSAWQSKMWYWYNIDILSSPLTIHLHSVYQQLGSALRHVNISMNRKGLHSMISS